MASPQLKVEVAFNLELLPSLTLALDDPIRGQLDYGYAHLSGTNAYLDLTEYVQEVRVSRGKSRLLDRYEAGTADVRFTNSNRYFDPLYSGSPFFGSIRPRLDVRISSNGVYIFIGSIDDWNIEYDPSGPSFATIKCSDDFVYLNQTLLDLTMPPVELSSDRVTRILDLPEVNWASTKRDIKSGLITVQADTISQDTNTLAYLQLVETTETGHLFISRDGKLTFLGKDDYTKSGLIFADNNTGIKYSELSVIFGTELMYNNISSNAAGGGATYTATNDPSVALYGNLTLNIPDVLNEYDTDIANAISYLVQVYGDPEYRFDTMSVVLNEQTTEDQDSILELDFGHFVNVTFTPSHIPPAINQYAEVIKITHEITRQKHTVTLGLGGYQSIPLILNDDVFGVLDSARLGYDGQL